MRGFSLGKEEHYDCREGSKDWGRCRLTEYWGRD